MLPLLPRYPDPSLRLHFTSQAPHLVSAEPPAMLHCLFGWWPLPCHVLVSSCGVNAPAPLSCLVPSSSVHACRQEWSPGYDPELTLREHPSPACANPGTPAARRSQKKGVSPAHCVLGLSMPSGTGPCCTPPPSCSIAIPLSGL